MGESLLVELLVLLALIAGNGVLAGSEIAVVALRQSRLAALVDRGAGGARAVQRLREHPERFLATVQIGITVVGATAGAFGGATFAADLAPWLRRVEVLAPYAEELALGTVIALVSYLSLVLGELVPKSLALRAPERYALLVGAPLWALSRAAGPLVALLTASSNAVLRIFGDRTTFAEARVTVEELRRMVEDAAHAGAVHPRVGEIAARAFGFGALRASDVMVPRPQVAAVPRDAPPDEVRRLLLEEGHTRMPVFEGQIDNVVGYVSAKDVLALAWEGHLIVLEDLIRPAFFVPETMRAVDLLQALQQRRVHLAVVVDEQGGMAGIVTLEDIVEELVGEIQGEGGEAEPVPRWDPDGAALVSGQTAVRDVNRALGIRLPEGPGFTTIAGLCIHLGGRIPAVGERLRTEQGPSLEIVDASARRVRAVRLRRTPVLPPG